MNQHLSFLSGTFFTTGGNPQQNHQLSNFLTRKQHFYHEHRSVFTQGKKTHVTITCHALATLIHRMLEITYYSVIMYVSSQETERLRIGAEDIKDNRQSQELQTWYYGNHIRRLSLFWAPRQQHNLVHLTVLWRFLA